MRVFWLGLVWAVVGVVGVAGVIPSELSFDKERMQALLKEENVQMKGFSILPNNEWSDKVVADMPTLFCFVGLYLFFN